MRQKKSQSLEMAEAITSAMVKGDFLTYAHYLRRVSLIRGVRNERRFFVVFFQEMWHIKTKEAKELLQLKKRRKP